MKATGGAQPSQADKILAFYKELNPDFRLEKGIEIMNPFTDPRGWSYTTQFYQRFYSDNKKRKLVFGINPGRFGAGITGVPFTDPIRLANVCAIDNDFPKKAELSSIFVYDVVERYGGPQAFFGDVFITALSPLGYTLHGKNLNYYDDPQLLRDTEPFIIDCIRKQISMLHSEPVAYCLGEGTNFKIFNRLNERFRFFEQIIPLPHPRWIMQYRRKQMDEFAERYVSRLRGG